MKTTILIFSLFTIVSFAGAQEDNTAAIKNTIMTSYIEGIYTKGDSKAIADGWHESAEIIIFDNNEVYKNDVSYWIEYFKINEALDPKIKHEIIDIEITDKLAVVKLVIKQDSNSLITDYISLYNFNDGWKIVSKINYIQTNDNNRIVSK